MLNLREFSFQNHAIGFGIFLLSPILYSTTFKDFCADFSKGFCMTVTQAFCVGFWAYFGYSTTAPWFNTPKPKLSATTLADSDALKQAHAHRKKTAQQQGCTLSVLDPRTILCPPYQQKKQTTQISTSAHSQMNSLKHT